MKNIYFKIILVLLFSFLSFKCINQYFSYPKSAIVKEVIDGDTILLYSGKMVRLLGLNTPETKMHIDGKWIEKESLWGRKAYIFSRNTLKDKKIRIEYDKKRKDRYSRLLGYVFLEDNFINEILLKKGLAVIDIRAPNFKYLKTLSLSFKYAKDNSRGLWADLDIVDSKDADKYEGDIVAVRGRVLDVYNSKELIFFLLPFEFKFVIFKKSFPDLDTDRLLNLKDNIITVVGMVKKYKSSYQMVIHHPYQLEVLR